MRATLRNVLLALSLLAALPRCAKEPTALFVRVTADPSLQTMWQSMPNFASATASATVSVYDANRPGSAALDVKTIPLGNFQTETTFLVESKGAATKVRIDVAATMTLTFRLLAPNQMFTMTNRVITPYVEDQVREVSVVFYGPCRTQTACSASQRCNASGACEDATVQSADHPY